jgi:hypothetical protein
LFAFTDIIILVVLFVWLILSIGAQFKGGKLRASDFLSLLPSFRFFAPRPVTRDIVIYAHALDENGRQTVWKELFYETKKWYCFLWNPKHKLRKAVVDLYSELDDFREADKIWHVTFPYLIILHASNALFEDDPHYTKVQFMITCFAGYEEEVHDIIFLSNIHEIGRINS